MLEKIKTINREIQERAARQRHIFPCIDQAVIRAKQDEIIEKLNILIEKHNDAEERERLRRFREGSWDLTEGEGE